MPLGFTARGGDVDSEKPLSEQPFSEKGFYLSELRDRTLAIAGNGDDLHDAALLLPALEELQANRTRVVLISDARAQLEAIAPGSVLGAEDLARLPGRVWRLLAERRRAGIETRSDVAFAAGCVEISVALGIGKLVWVDARGGLRNARGGRDSFIDAVELRGRIAEADPERRDTLAEIEKLLSLGLGAVNLCTLEGVSDELFTYDGSGTLFTREGYVHVHRLGLDDFDAAADLIERGMAEGYLARRSSDEIERVLESGFGAFVGGDHLAGIGTLLVHAEANAGEIGSLYTLTRFVGEGVGGHLVRHALERARERGCAFVFACTTSERVTAFFERNGFRQATPAEIPVAKWEGYDPVRRTQVTCLRHDLG